MRSARRAVPPGPHLEAKIDAFEALRVVDFGDAPVLPADPVRTHAEIERTVGEVVAAGAVPVVLGGDHSITEPNVRAVAARHGPVGLVHFDTHTDTGTEVFGVELSHGTPMYRLVRDGHVDATRYVQIGLRGYWPGEAEFAWQREQGITAFFMHDVRDLGIREIVERTVAIVGDGPVFLTVDVDVLDPAFAPGTGTPEPGGMTSVDLLWACRELARRLELVGMDVVEVLPTAIGSADVTALVADRVVREALTGSLCAAAEAVENGDALEPTVGDVTKCLRPITACPRKPNASVAGFTSGTHRREGSASEGSRTDRARRPRARRRGRPRAGRPRRRQADDRGRERHLARRTRRRELRGELPLLAPGARRPDRLPGQAGRAHISTRSSATARRTRRRATERSAPARRRACGRTTRPLTGCPRSTRERRRSCLSPRPSTTGAEHSPA